MAEARMHKARRWWPIAGAVLLALAIAAAFLAYLQPEFVVDLASRLFLCS